MRVEQVILRKAFVTVSHKILTDTHLMQGLDEQTLADWIGHWQNRPSNTKSSWVGVTRAVLQRSVLGPALLSLFITDLDDGHSVPAEVCRLHKTGRSGWYNRGLCCLPKRHQQAGEMG